MKVLAKVTSLVETYLEQNREELDFAMESAWERYCISNKLEKLDEELEYAKEEFYLDKEVYNWYLVDEPLGKRLIKLGEIVLEIGGNYFWGRTTTGQSYSDDEIYREAINK